MFDDVVSHGSTDVPSVSRHIHLACVRVDLPSKTRAEVIIIIIVAIAFSLSKSNYKLARWTQGNNILKYLVKPRWCND